MHQYAVQILSILATLLLASAGQAADPPTKDQEVLMQAERSFGQAVLKQDAKMLDAIEADEFIFTDPDGVVSGKAEDMAPAKAGKMKFSSYVTSEMKAMQYGDTGVVVGRQTQKGTLNGTDVSGTYRFTDTYVKRDGRWQCVAGQLTRIAKP